MTFKMSVCGNQDREKVERTRSPEGDVCSMASCRSKEFQINFTDGDFPTDLSKQTETPRIRRQKQLDLIFTDVEQNAVTLLKIEIKRFQKLLSPDYPACPEGEGEGKEEEEVYRRVREGALKITLHVLEDLKHTELATRLQNPAVSLSVSG